MSSDPAPVDASSSGPRPAIAIRAAVGAGTAVVVVLNGGRANSVAPASRQNLAYLRMRPFAQVVHRDLAAHGVAVWQLKYRVRGCNGSAEDPVKDVRWVLARIAKRHPGVPVVLVGHSMGGRAGLYCAGSDQVIGVCALAPWIEARDPIDQLAGRTIVIAHGDRDQMTDPRRSRTYAVAAEGVGATVVQFDVVGEKHAMLRRARDWHTLVRDSVRLMLRYPYDGQLATIIGEPDAHHFAVPLANRPGRDRS